MTTACSSLNTCRSAFPALARTLKGQPLAFFDGPGGTQVPQAVMDAICDYYTRCNANTHGEFITAQESDQLLLEVRGKVAAFLGAPSIKEISFGANMTTLAYSLSRAHRPDPEARRRSGDHPAGPRGQPRPLADPGGGGGGGEGDRAAPGRHPRPRGHGPQDRPPHPAGGHRLLLQRPGHGQRPGPGPQPVQGRGRLAADRRGARRAPLPPGRGGPGHRLPALLRLQVVRSPRGHPVRPPRAAGAAAHGPPEHPGSGGPVPDRDRHPQPRRPGRGRRGGGLPGRVLGRRHPARAGAAHHDRPGRPGAGPGRALPRAGCAPFPG